MSEYKNDNVIINFGEDLVYRIPKNKRSDLEKFLLENGSKCKKEETRELDDNEKGMILITANDYSVEFKYGVRTMTWYRSESDIDRMCYSIARKLQLTLKGKKEGWC